MNKEQAKKLFDKYVKNECSAQEMGLLHHYLESFQNHDELWSELNYDKEIRDKLWTKINAAVKIKATEEKAFSVKKYYKYAAVLVVLISSILWYQATENKDQGAQITVADNAIILKTSENKHTEINTGGEQIVLDRNGKVVGNQSGDQINYTPNEQITKLVYNEIIVPNGKKFRLVLSDGSFVHLNAGSSLKYPVNFVPGKKRSVFLKGEAYFEVTKDLDHPFQVMTEEMEVNVVGTHFNVSSYKDSNTFTVLAEGSVVVHDKMDPEVNFKTIKPGEKAIILDNAIAVTEVDLNAYLGWREGLLAFNNEPFINIIQKIERQYGVVIANEFQALEPVRFRGLFKEESITDLMGTFKESAGFEYVITNNKIIIKPMKE